MPVAIYPERAISSPDAPMLRPPITPIPKCWEAELSPLTQLKGSLDRLPEGEATLALFMRCSPEGANRVEMSAESYERQAVDFHLHKDGQGTHNIHTVVFRFEEQPNATIPLIGLYVGERLIMRGGLTRLLILPEEVDLSQPQVRFGPGALRLRF